MKFVTKDLTQFEQEFHSGDILAIEVPGYSQPIIAIYKDAYVDGTSFINATYGIDCYNQFSVNHKYGIYSNDVRLASPSEVSVLNHWIKKYESNSDEITIMNKICSNSEAFWDGSGLIVLIASDIMVDTTNGCHYDLLHIGVFNTGIRLYAVEVDEDGCDYVPEFIDWPDLTKESQKMLLEIKENDIQDKKIHSEEF